MEFVNEKEFQNALDYIEVVFTLGGLSECGKTTAGIYLESLPLNIKRYKIIQIEREMMLERGFDLSNGMKDEHFLELYDESKCEEVFKEFVVRLVEHLKRDNLRRVSIESLYRAPFGAFLKKYLGNRCANIYIEAPIEVRVKRQLCKVSSEAHENEKISYEEMLARVLQKDFFKEQHRASECKVIADYVVDNNENIGKQLFLDVIEKIAVETITHSQVNISKKE